MFRRTNVTILSLVAAWLGIVPLPVAVRGQIEFGPLPTRAVEQSFLNVFLPAPRDLKQHLSRARKALSEKQYSEAVNELGTLLTNPEAEDYFIGAPGDSGTQTSLKAEAQRLLGSIPVKGRESYELQFGAAARLLLNQAVQEHDLQRLTDVTRMYFHTKAGYEATMLLGRHHLDQGRPLAGALCFQRVLNSLAAAQFEPELSLLLATCWLYADQPDKAEETLVALQQRTPKATIRAGKADYPLFDASADALRWLTQITGKRPVVRGTDETEWRIFRGNAMRNARTSGGLPLRNYRWRVPTVNDGEEQELVRNLNKQYVDSRIAALPGVQPLAVGDVVLMRTASRLLAVDFRTGKRIWVFPWADESSSDALWQADNPPPGTGDHSSSQRVSELSQRLWEDAPHGQLSGDGEAVYLLDELGFANPTGFPVQMLQGGLRQDNQNWPRSHNKLVALSLARQGALLWVVGGEDGEDEPKLAGAFFLGAPLPLLGQVYVMAEVKGEIRLVVLDSITGRLQWSQQLAHVEATPILQDGPRRLAGASPSFANGVLVCPTSAGAVVGVDLSTRALLWGFAHQKAVNPYNRGFGRVYMRETRAIGSRWADGTVTIAEGKVLVTPVESDEMYCLDLLTGTSLWPDKMRRDELLYLACVDQGKAIFVGKERVSAVQLADGEPAWTLKIPDDAMPSGRGFFSDRYYYLPTTAARVLQIDVATGTIAASVETDFVLGNLICFKGNVISHGVDWLAAFHQEQPLRASVQRRLEDNPNDTWALARHGELLLGNGREDEALRAIRRAYELDPQNDQTRALLVNTLLVALRKDYVANRQIANELEGLIDQPVHRAEFLRLKATGLLKAGKTREAFDAFVQMASLDHGDGGNATNHQLESVQRDHTVRMDRWIMKRLAELYRAADDAGRQDMDAVIQAQLRTALESEHLAGLRRFLSFFGFHADADRARLVAASRLIDTGELLEAELLLNQLSEASADSTQATAVALLAHLFEQAGLLEESGAQYRRVASQWGDVECWDGKTGRQLLESLTDRGTLGPYLKAPPPWSLGKVDVESGGDHVINTPSYQRVYPISVRDRRGQVPEGLHVALDQRSNAIIVRDGHGKELAHVSLSSPDGRPRFYTTNYAVTHCKVNGHLLLLVMGYELIAIDLLQASREENEAILWRQDLARAMPDPFGQNASRQRVSSKLVENPWGAGEHQATDAYGRLVGATGALSAGGLCFFRHRELICVDPVSGETIWVRSDLEPGSDLFGDDQYVMVAPPDQAELLVFDAFDGTLLGHREAPEPSHRWATFGRHVLSWRQRQNRLELVLDDVWTQTTLWQQDFPIGSRGWIIDQEEVGVMQPDGKFLVWSLRDRQVKVDETLKPEQILTNIYVLRSQGQYLLVTNNPVTRTMPDVNINPAPGSYDTPLISGFVYAFDRSTGKSQWQNPVQIEQFALLLDQPSEVPVLTFLRHVITAAGGAQRRMQSSILCLDKRDGSVVLSTDDIRAPTYTYEIEGNLPEQAVIVRLPGKTFTLRFKNSAAQPAEPNRTGSAVKSPTDPNVSIADLIRGVFRRSL